MADDLVIEQAVAQSEGSAQAAPDTNSVPTDTTAAPNSTQTTITDLDKLDRVRFGGKEYPIKELRASFMRQADYTNKTKELAENRKYAENFAYDLIQVVKNPRMLDEFKSVYPAKYHALVEQYLKEHSSGQSVGQTEQASGSDGLPPEFEKVLQSKLRPYEEQLSEFKALKDGLRQQEVRSISEQIETIHDRMGKKYEFADPETVDRRVIAAQEELAKQGYELDARNLAKVYETIYKDMHSKTKARLDKLYTSKANEQVKAGRAVKDVGGGSVPGSAPKKFSNSAELFKDMNKTLLGR